jgi:uncharacterized SAM-binding protein YcdF (DUF218 family)
MSGGWWHSPLLKLYDRLTRNDSPQPADMIFVMAGRMERKRYGLELYAAGLAPELVLSVGRFEVSRMHTLGVDGLDELVTLRNRTEPHERHFLVKLDASGVRVEKIKCPRWSTYGEALGLRQFLEQERPCKVIVVSTDVHLRRVVLTFAKVFRDAPFQFLYCSVPSRFGFLKRDEWWMRADDRWFVIKEAMKLAGYCAILSMPAWAIRRLMRLKD